MRIADQIALVLREFVAGNTLLIALAKQEGINELQAASWFMRHQSALDRLPMLSLNRERADFREINTPWSHDIFFELTAQDPSEINWDEDHNGYIGGWLSSHLKKFFIETGVPYPLAEVSDSENQNIEAPLQSPVSMQNFLATHGIDFTTCKDWLETFGGDTRRTSLALKKAISNIGGCIPIYAETGPPEINPPVAINSTASMEIWSDLLVGLMDGAPPDIIFSADGTEIDVYSLYVRDTDCAEFLRQSGLSLREELAGLTGGIIIKGTLDLNAALERSHRSNLRLPGSSSSRSTPPEPERELSSRERAGLLRIIGALLDVVSGDLPGVVRHSSISSEAELIRMLDQHFDGFEGLSASNLSRKFPEAKRLLRN